MILRFSLYGFLKNQRYFEAFLVLAFLEKGLDFFQIGLLVACRELTVNVFEIPSGAIADVRGRRASMVLSFVAYIGSFVILGACAGLAPLLAAMVLYGIGDAFRTGTHKAMIFAWLRLEGRTDERTRVYGYTRSWSKFGSAASVVIGAVIVLASDGYAAVFFAAIVPYGLGVVNLLGYPKALDGARDAAEPPAGVVRHMLATARLALTRRGLRRLVLESMGFEGVFAAAKDYLQPVLAATVVALAGGALATGGGAEPRRVALLVAPVYFALFVLAGVASRAAHRVAEAAGGDDRAARRLWGADVLVFAGLLAAALLELHVALIVAFVALHVLQNLWRPVLISRFDAHGAEAQGASILSIESQAARASTMIIAPLLGLAVDRAMDAGGAGPYWPVGAVGLGVAIGFFASARVSSTPTAPDPGVQEADDRR
jgi:MFS family permease